jgi:hypothetical protein
MTIMTCTELVVNPDLIRRFVRATAKSWEAKKNRAPPWTRR